MSKFSILCKSQEVDHRKRNADKFIETENGGCQGLGREEKWR